MKDYYKLGIVLCFLIFNVSLTQAQSMFGKLLDQDDKPIIGAEVSLKDTDEIEISNASGIFRFYDLQVEAYTLIISKDNAELFKQEVQYNGTPIDLGDVIIDIANIELTNSNLAIITLTDAQLSEDEDNGEISSLLSASDDIFLNTAAFGFGSARFRTRGLDSEYEALYVNGIPVNELENGRIYFGQWGGLNDVFRNVHNNYGISSSEYGIGGLNGNTNINIRAGSQRVQTRASYAAANRSYNNRLMITHSTGMNENGWAFSASGSRRWAKEGHVTGTFYDSWSYFLGVEKEINKQHSLFLNILGNKNERGKSGASLQEIIDLTGDRFYNPHWGWQNGEKRNSRVGHSHQPMVFLGHDWSSTNSKLTINTALSYQFGPNGGTALNWDGAPNPAGDYHQKLLSRIDNPTLAVEIEQLMRENPDYFQVNWDFIYESNRLNLTNVENADGIEGNTRTGIRAKYWVEDRRYDSKELNGVSTLNYELNSNNNLSFGLKYQNYIGHNFTEIEDLLGADFHLDVDKYADGIANPGTEQKDLNNPNRITKEGDIFGYDFNSHINRNAVWIQDNISFSKFDAFIGGELSNYSFYRVGNMRNGYYPEASFGQSETQSFSNYKVKGGATYKINGRNYIWTSAFVGTEAPSFRDAYMSARITDIVNPLLENSKQKSAEVGFIHRSPSLQLKALGYYADIDDETELVFFFSEEFVQGQLSSGTFGSFSNSNIDKRHVGLELAAQYKLNSSWTATAVAAFSQHLYDSRWQQYALSDELGFFREDVTVYSNGFYVESSPQTALNFEIEYRSPNYWFATLSANYFDNRYLDFSPDKRIEATTNSIDPSELSEIVVQEKLPSAYTLDLFAYKSFKINDHFIYLTLSMNNILNNKNFITGGYEQLRFDPDRGADYFAPKYYYGYGRNYFLGIAFRL